MTPSRLSQVLEVLYVCESNFEYKVSSEVAELLLCDITLYVKRIAC